MSTVPGTRAARDLYGVRSLPNILRAFLKPALFPL